MIKIFQTGDNHIGLKYTSHEQSKKLSQRRTDDFERLVEKANSEECDIFAVTGDLFENTYGISKKTVNCIVNILQKFRGTVVIIPGNHDYYDKSANVWEYFKESARDINNILLANEYRPYEIYVRDETVVIYPAFCKSLHSEKGENNLSWIKNENIIKDDRYKIGMAHGAVEGETIDNEGKYFLMTRDELYDIPVDIWLIGHTHVPFPNNLTEEMKETKERIFNAGTHMQMDVSCNTDGECFIIEIDSNKNITAQKYVSGTVNFKRIKVEFSSEPMRETLDRALNALKTDTVTDIICLGAVNDDDYENRADILNSALMPFIEGTYDDYGLSRLITAETIEREFAETSFAASFLKELLQNPKEAQMAYEMLREIREKT